MKFSIVQGRPGFDPSHSRRIKEVLVDGIAVDGCIEADEEQGYALKLAPDHERGGFKLDPQGGYVTLRLEGKTKIIMQPKNARDWDKHRRGEAKVAVGRDTNGDILVQVYSNARPGAIKQMRLERSQLPGSDAVLCQRVGMAAGAAAEMLAEQFEDTIEPSAAASEAVRQCALMLKGE